MNKIQAELIRIILKQIKIEGGLIEMSSLSDLYKEVQNETINIEETLTPPTPPIMPVEPVTKVVSDSPFPGVAVVENDDDEDGNEMSLEEVGVQMESTPIITAEDVAKEMYQSEENRVEVVEPIHVHEVVAVGIPNDSYLTTLLDLYTPDAVTDKDEKTNVLPKKISPLYEVEVVSNNYKNRIIDVFDVDDGTRASYSLEELGLHNRLTEVQGIERELEHHVLIQAPTGDLVVAKDLNTGSKIVNEFMEEAIECVRQGNRIEIELLETYQFEDKHGRILTRERFRATMSEIRAFIQNTGMRGRITKDAILVIFE